jgi:GNAT superfamily N-acetyltransferase
VASLHRRPKELDMSTADPTPADPVRVWRATASDVLVAARVLTEAFADYPWTRFTVAADNHNQRIEALQRLLLERVALPYGAVHLATVGNGRGEPDAVAVWLPPEPAVPEAVWTDLAGVREELLGDRATAAAEADAASARLRPATAHWLLATVGVRPGKQGRGLGRAVLTPILRQADTEQAHAYLETSSAANVTFYTRLGFTVSGEVDLADGRLHIWAMLRPPTQGAPQRPGDHRRA